MSITVKVSLLKGYILYVWVTWLSVQAIGRCSTSLRVALGKGESSSLYIPIHWGKVGSPPDATQHIHRPKKEQVKLRQWNWTSTECGTGFVFMGYSRKYIYPSRKRLVRKDLCSLKCPSMAWQKYQTLQKLQGFTGRGDRNKPRYFRTIPLLLNM